MLARSAVRQPEVIRNRVSAIEESILDDARKRLEKIGSQVGDKGKRPALGKEVRRLARALQGTPLRDRALDLLAKLE